MAPKSAGGPDPASTTIKRARIRRFELRREVQRPTLLERQATNETLKCCSEARRTDAYPSLERTSAGKALHCCAPIASIVADISGFAYGARQFSGVIPRCTYLRHHFRKTFMFKLISLACTLVVLAAAASATPTTASAAGHISSVSDSTSVSSPQVANRKGSKRVGGKNSKGKGGKYIGGRK
jgi:hypothetical protein